ncbi:MAG: M16 family metallopeptidase [Thiohalomonadales bacterium]
MGNRIMVSKQNNGSRVILRTLILILGSFFILGVSQASPKIQHWLTKNGARVYFVPAAEIPMVDVQVVFDAGAARDGEKLGLAVMTNGMLAEGAAELDANQISEGFESAGARFSNSAHRDMAVIGLRSLTEADKLQSTLALLTTVLSKPSFPEDAFDRERKRLLVGLEQRKQSPRSLGSEAYYNALYQGHPYGNLPVGNKETINGLSTQDLKAFYEKYYVGKNAVIAIVGAVDRKAAEGIAEQVVGGLAAGSAAENLPAVKPLADAQTIKIEFPSTQTHVTVGSPGVKRGDPDYFSMYVGNHILGGSGLISRLSEEIREKRGLSYSTYSGLTPMRKSGPYSFGLQTRNESAAEALKILMQEIKKFVADGPSADELIAAKKNITGGFPLRISSNKKIVGYIAMIGFYQLPLDYLDTFNANVEKVTLDSIKKAFQQRVNPDKMITVLVGKVS